MMMGTMRFDGLVVAVEPTSDPVVLGATRLLVVMVEAVAVVVDPSRPAAALAGVPNLNILKKFNGVAVSDAVPSALAAG